MKKYELTTDTKTKIVAEGNWKSDISIVYGADNI